MAGNKTLLRQRDMTVEIGGRIHVGLNQMNHNLHNHTTSSSSASEEDPANVMIPALPPSLLLLQFTHQSRALFLHYTLFDSEIMSKVQHITLNPNREVHATRDAPQKDAPPASSLPDAKEIKVKPNSGAPAGSGNASLYFVGTATTIL
jgi:hypothetical protein